MSDWAYLTHPETKGSTRVPNVEDVIESHKARGWKVADEPAPEVFVPRTVEPDADQWVELWHTPSGGHQRIPNHPDALQEAFDKGWTTTPPTEVVEEPEPAREGAREDKPSTTAKKEKE